jgi:hypothetical protein
MSRVEAALAAAGLSEREQCVVWGLAQGQSLGQVAVDLGMRSKQLAHYTAKVAGRKLGIEQSLVEALQGKASAPGMGVSQQEAGRMLSAAGSRWSGEQVRNDPAVRAAARRGKRPLEAVERQWREWEDQATQLLQDAI